MHDKFIIVDGVTVETGSFNFTNAAQRHNAEKSWCSRARRRSRPGTNRSGPPVGGEPGLRGGRGTVNADQRLLQTQSPCTLSINSSPGFTSRMYRCFISSFR